ncbi:MAG: cytidylyltransferase domain-containing protein [Methanobacterium sp.]
MRIGVIIQARSASTRLPGKVLKNLPWNSEVTVLGQVIRRCKQSNELDLIIVATTMDSADEAIVDIAMGENVPCFRGSRSNVLERYYKAANEYGLDVIVRVTSDCPCVDPGIIDDLIVKHLESDCDYTSNTLVRTFPVGLDVEVFNFDALRKCLTYTLDDLDREHVTRFIYTHPDIFRIRNIEAVEDYYAPEIRVTLDTGEDYMLLSAVYDYLYERDKFFDTGDIISLFKFKPWLHFINGKVLSKKVFDNFDDELVEALKYLELQEFNRIKKFLQDNCKS